MSAADAATAGDVWRALANVPDPEIPAVSVVDMGMIADVEVRAGHARVVFLPTFTGCPAVDVIRTDIAGALGNVDGIEKADVETTFDPPWTSDRITPQGRAKLRSFGLAPPGHEGPVLVTHIGLPELAVCPFCGSRNTTADSLFGPTPCRATYHCRSCRNPFEQFKTV